MSTRPCMPKWSTVPRPFRPNTPLACASSTIMIAPNSSASVAQRRQRPEVAVHAEDAVGDEQLALRRRAARCRISRAASTSLCGNTLMAARLRRQPSMMLAWFSSSEMTTSSLREDGRHRAGVRREAALEDDDGLGVLELGEPALELHVHGHRAGDACAPSRSRRRSCSIASSARSRSVGCVVSPR